MCCEGILFDACHDVDLGPMYPGLLFFFGTATPHSFSYIFYCINHRLCLVLRKALNVGVGRHLYSETLATNTSECIY